MKILKAVKLQVLVLAAIGVILVVALDIAYTMRFYDPNILFVALGFLAFFVPPVFFRAGYVAAKKLSGSSFEGGIGAVIASASASIIAAILGALAHAAFTYLNLLGYGNSTIAFGFLNMMMVILMFAVTAFFAILVALVVLSPIAFLLGAAGGYFASRK